MIRNERQLRTSRARHRELVETARQLEGMDRDTYLAIAAEVEREINEYIGIREGCASHFNVRSMDELADALIKARIARGWTQRELANQLGVSEQMVQRDEARDYEQASLARLADVADVLGFTLEGVLRPVDAPSGPQSQFGSTVFTVRSSANVGQGVVRFHGPLVVDSWLSGGGSSTARFVTSSDSIREM